MGDWRWGSEGLLCQHGRGHISGPTRRAKAEVLQTGPHIGLVYPSTHLSLVNQLDQMPHKVVQVVTSGVAGVGVGARGHTARDLVSTFRASTIQQWGRKGRIRFLHADQGVVRMCRFQRARPLLLIQTNCPTQRMQPSNTRHNKDERMRGVEVERSKCT